MATVPERVNEFVTQFPDTCDNCAQYALGLPQHNQVQQITSALATTREFDRGKGRCARCGKTKVVTRRVA